MEEYIKNELKTLKFVEFWKNEMKRESPVPVKIDNCVGCRCYVKYSNKTENWQQIGVVKKVDISSSGHQSYSLAFEDLPGTYLSVESSRNKPLIFTDLYLSKNISSGGRLFKRECVIAVRIEEDLPVYL